MTETRKDIFLTEKKYMGLLGISFFAIGAISAMLCMKLADNRVFAVGESKRMWVSLCDTNERNVLVKKGGVMKIDDKVRLEILKEDIPQGEVKIRVIAIGQDGTAYVSKDFDVEKTP